ncbi:hypothetical protein [Anabaena sp. 4-3]|uniref:hypothetical protein n=1 Tax=Anabaena sp. 4-3 TaxID=1811979 RepID=UPI0012E7F4D4|nr:hypothetical protein [Anabaena sp. 4-3]
MLISLQLLGWRKKRSLLNIAKKRGDRYIKLSNKHLDSLNQPTHLARSTHE